MPPISNDSDHSFPFPLQLRRDGEPEIRHLPIYRMKAAELKRCCKDYGLGQSGRKLTLCERLEAFSGDRDVWDWCATSSFVL
ncbi:hypothetical protein M405DRAFT_868291 [Rhizopogon salebrosus TDB-379]|nr:hypothetical protein M405DRAFT_868291 [Rhizopogon salebrosus TDB-379]